MNERTRKTRPLTATAPGNIGAGAALENESLPDGWNDRADSETTRELVHIDGPAIVIRCDWSPRLRRILGYRRAETPAFYLAACTECWTTTIDRNSRPSLEMKTRVAACHVAIAHSAPETGHEICEHALERQAARTRAMTTQKERSS